MDYTITSLTTMKEAEGVVEVQRQAWQMADIGILPTFETKAVSDAGFVFVAKKGDVVIGFIYGYHHFPDVHYSHMMAVLPDYQGTGVGYELKKYHRKQALQSRHHVRLVQWTVDPLLPNNAYLNFAKLGGFCDTYKTDYYGDPERDGVEIYAGVATDRFKLSWPIHSNRVQRRMDDYRQDRVDYATLMDRAPVINSIEEGRYQGGTTAPSENFSVEMPADYQGLRRNHLELARDWRVRFREICTGAIKTGFVVSDYHHVKAPDSTLRNYYEFTHKDQFDV